MKVIVLQAHALHLGYLGCYGNEWVATPALARLAAEGVVFDRHLADCPGSGRGPWSGRYRFPFPETSADAPDGGLPELPEMLRAANIPLVHLESAAGEGVSAGWERALRGAREALDGLSGTRWLLWIELPSMQPPWDVPDDVLAPYFGDDADEDADEEEEPLEPLLDPPLGLPGKLDFALWEQLQRTYAGVVSHFDAGLAALLEDLTARDLLDEVLVVVTAAGGLALGEHGVVGNCRPWLHEELVHLPLIARFPRAAEAGRRVPALTQPVDLLPTLLEAFGVTAAPGHGHSLLPLARGEVEQVRAYACSGLRHGPALEWALRTPEWCLLLPLAVAPADPPRNPQLYLKPDDRWEVNDVRQHHQELAEHLETVLRAFAEATRASGPLLSPELAKVEQEPR